MSYDLMVFRADAAPNNEKAFLEWYELQTEWSEGHSYDDPASSSQELRNWFMEMKETFPAMNGPYASKDVDDPKVTDYCIGKDVIYAAFAWSQTELAYMKMNELAAKHKVGFYDASGTGGILVPDGSGGLKPLSASGASGKPWWKIW